MTREEAIEILSRPKSMKGVPAEILTAHTMAIKAMQTEPCEDAISRQYLLDNCVVDKVTMPYVPVSKIENAPPVTPQPKMGRWIESHIPESILCECSVCGFSCGAYSFNFCPNCGAKMEEGE